MGPWLLLISLHTPLLVCPPSLPQLPPLLLPQLPPPLLPRFPQPTPQLLVLNQARARNLAKRQSNLKQLNPRPSNRPRRAKRARRARPSQVKLRHWGYLTCLCRSRSEAFTNMPFSLCLKLPISHQCCEEHALLSKLYISM